MSAFFHTLAVGLATIITAFTGMFQHTVEYVPPTTAPDAQLSMATTSTVEFPSQTSQPSEQPDQTSKGDSTPALFKPAAQLPPKILGAKNPVDVRTSSSSNVISTPQQPTTPIAPVLQKSAQLATVIQSQASATSSKPVPPVSGVALPYRSESFSAWKGVSGRVATTSSGALSVHAATSTTGGQAIFPDSKNWVDYRYTASVIVSNGNVTLIGRYVDGNNFAACTFSGNHVEIQERLKGKTKTVVSATIVGMSASPYFQTSTNFSMQVRGTVIGCTALGNNDNATYSSLDKSLAKGGIGIGTANRAPGIATLLLQSVHVE